MIAQSSHTAHMEESLLAHMMRMGSILQLRHVAALRLSRFLGGSIWTAMHTATSIGCTVVERRTKHTHSLNCVWLCACTYGYVCMAMYDCVHVSRDLQSEGLMTCAVGLAGRWPATRNIRTATTWAAEADIAIRWPSTADRQLLNDRNFRAVRCHRRVVLMYSQ
jgi:hypothetical protein